MKTPTKKEKNPYWKKDLDKIKELQEALAVRNAEVQDAINKVHKHWHPIDQRGAFNNERCNEDNCSFRHIESTLKARNHIPLVDSQSQQEYVPNKVSPDFRKGCAQINCAFMKDSGDCIMDWNDMKKCTFFKARSKK